MDSSRPLTASRMMAATGTAATSSTSETDHGNEGHRHLGEQPEVDEQTQHARQNRALPRESGALGGEGRFQRHGYRSPTTTIASRATAASTAVSNGMAGEDGNGCPVRMARSFRTHRTYAPVEQTRPQTSSSSDASFSSRLNRPTMVLTAAMPAPPARKPSEVRIQARKVRSLASEKRASGSEPTP